jgi:signal transduction histidine kinase
VNVLWLPTTILASALASATLAGALSYLAFLERDQPAWRYWCAAYAIETLRLAITVWSLSALSGGSLSAPTGESLSAFSGGSLSAPDTIGDGTLDQLLRIMLIVEAGFLFLGVAEINRIAKAGRIISGAVGLLLAWEALATTLELAPLSVALPHIVVVGGAFIWFGWSFRKGGEQGPGQSRKANIPVALVMIAIGLHGLDAPLLAGIPWLAPYGFMLSQVLLLSLGLLLVVAVLQGRNRRLVQAIVDADRIQAEAEASRIRQMHEELAKTLETRTEGIAIFDADDRFVRCNAAFRSHTGQESVVLEPGVHFEDYVRNGIGRDGTGRHGTGQPDLVTDEEDMDALVRRRIALHQDAPSSFELQRPDGGWTLAREKRTDDGGWVITTTDITELKDRETRLRDAVAEAEVANRSKMEFLATMSHELRTPLNAIIGFSDMIKSDASKIQADRLLEYTSFIHESGTHLLSLINDILDVARIEAGKYRVRDEIFELEPLVHEARRMIMHKATEGGLNVSVELPPHVTHVNGDRLAIKQVVLNLLSNAIKFTPANGHISIEAEHFETGALIIRVRDTGIGIPDQMRDIIFEAFPQIETVFSRTHQGSGLGLFICKNLIEAHGGEIVIGPNPEASGTLVTVTLPDFRVTRVEDATESAAAGTG